MTHRTKKCSKSKYKAALRRNMKKGMKFPAAVRAAWRVACR